MKLSDALTRQLDIIPLAILGQRITVIGAGGIGSFVVLALAKMGFGDITVYDDDVVSVENMNNQFFRHTDIGKPKVEALQQLVEDFTTMKITAVKARLDLSKGWAEPQSGILIVAVDNMATRGHVFKHAEATGFDLIIDPRMSAEDGLVYSYRPGSDQEREDYSGSLYSDENAVQDRCTAKSTMYTVLGISSTVAGIVKQWVTKNPRTKSAIATYKSGMVETYAAEEVA